MQTTNLLPRNENEMKKPPRNISHLKWMFWTQNVHFSMICLGMPAYTAAAHIIIDSMHFCMCAWFHLGRTLSVKRVKKRQTEQVAAHFWFTPQKINCVRNLWADMKALVCAQLNGAHDIQHIRNFIFIYDSCVDHCVCVVCGVLCTYGDARHYLWADIHRRAKSLEINY